MLNKSKTPNPSAIYADTGTSFSAPVADCHMRICCKDM